MPPSPAVNIQRLGAWLLKVNPRVTDLGPGPAATLGGLTERCVRPGYRLDLVRAGQPVLLWISGGSKACPAGIWARGVVSGPVAPPEGDSRTATMPIRVAPLERPLPRAELLRDPRLSGLEVLRMPFGSNPSWVDTDELAAIEERLAASDPGVGGALATRPATPGGRRGPGEGT